MLGRLAAINTTNRLSATMLANASVPCNTPACAPSRSRTGPATRQLERLDERLLAGAPPGGKVLASLCMPSVGKILRKRLATPHMQRAHRSGPSYIDSCLWLNALDVYGLGTLLALLRVVGDLGPLLERAVALAVDAGVMDKQVLVTVIRGNESEPLVVAEPLDCASRHGVNFLHGMCVLHAEDASQSFDLRALALLSPVLRAGHTARP